MNISILEDLNEVLDSLVKKTGETLEEIDRKLGELFGISSSPVCSHPATTNSLASNMFFTCTSFPSEGSDIPSRVSEALLGKEYITEEAVDKASEMIGVSSIEDQIRKLPWTRGVRFANSLSRGRNQDDLARHIQEWTSLRHPREVMHILQNAGVAAGVMMDCMALLEGPHLNERGFGEVQTHPDAGIWMMEYPTRALSMTPAHIRMPAPCFRQHNDYLFRELLALSDEEIIGDLPRIPENAFLLCPS